MSIKIPLPIVAALILAALLIPPAYGQLATGNEITNDYQHRDRLAIRDLLNLYEASFNEKDIEWRMSLCLETYQEFGFEEGEFLQVRDYEETLDEVGGYWDSVDSLSYSMYIVDMALDGPMAFVIADTSHVAPGEIHDSTVYFSLLKINGVWRIAWDSYNIYERHNSVF